MKSRNDPRHQSRVAAMQQIFAWQFNKDQEIEDKSEKVVTKTTEIDQVIAKCAPAWPISQIAQVDLSILRLAVYELLFEKKEPPRVVIDEAVEIGKEFGGPSCASFVNGVLGTVVKDYALIQEENEQNKTKHFIMTDIQANVLTEIAGISGQDLENIKENSQLSLDHNFTNEEIKDLRERLINYYKLPSDSLKITPESSVREIVAEIQENIENN